jgi:hypothetical protein
MPLFSYVDKKQKGILVLYDANTGTGGVKSRNCVKIARCPCLVSFNNEANVRIVKIAKPQRLHCQNSKFLDFSVSKSWSEAAR